MLYKASITGSRCRQCSPLFWRLLYSVLKKAFWCTEWTCGVKKGLLRYARRFQRHSVQKTGSCGTEGIFGTRNPLLRYAMRLLCANSFQYNTMDFVTKICSGATTSVNYSYLWNGVKICALRASGDGDPVNFIDSDGRSWFQNKKTGQIY